VQRSDEQDGRKSVRLRKMHDVDDSDWRVD
jgi:hypothetical protein